MIEFIVANRVGECRVPWFFIPFPSFFIQTHKHPTHGRNHTHFRNKPTNHKNSFGSSWERWIGDRTTVDGGNGGRWKELDHRSSESRGVGLLFLIDLGLLFLCWYAFFSSVDLPSSLWSLQLESLEFFLHCWSLQLETHVFGFLVFFCGTRVLKTWFPHWFS